MINVYYEDCWNFPPTEKAKYVIGSYSLHTKIKKIPRPLFGYSGYWVDIVHSSVVSAYAMVGKKVWQPTRSVG